MGVEESEMKEKKRLHGRKEERMCRSKQGRHLKNDGVHVGRTGVEPEAGRRKESFLPYLSFPFPSHHFPCSCCFLACVLGETVHACVLTACLC